MKHFLIRIPAENTKHAEGFLQLLESFHENLEGGQVSFEIASIPPHISLRFSCEDDLKGLVSGQIYSAFPKCEIENAEDIANINGNIMGGEISLLRSDLFPIKTFQEFEGDSLSGFLSILQKLPSSVRALLQIVIEPKKDSGFLHFWRSLQRKWEGIRMIFRMKYWFKKGDFQKMFADAFKKKETERLFTVSIRFGIFSPTSTSLKSAFVSLSHAFSIFNTIDFNGFETSEMGAGKTSKLLTSRKFGKSFLLSLSEIATLFHFPNPREIPNILYVLSAKSDPPSTLPVNTKDPEISFFGSTNFHATNIPFGIYRTDRRRHLYTVGKSGSGKSKFLELLIQSDILAGKGVGVLDPHGDLVDAVLRMVPPERIKDVVLFNPADENFPIAFNPLEKVPSALKMRVTIGFLEIFKKLFGSNWTDRLEHVLRYTVLALLDSPNTTVLSILKMLSDKNYRQYIVRNIEDDVVKNFWVNEFAGWSEKFDAEAITPLLNKVGQFVATNMIRNIVGQPENKVKFREIMDTGKILLMKVSKGMLGEENAGLMGAFAVTKIYQAAMSRADILEEQRKDFYLYVDEFHNFATDTFDEILSEARKYRLNLTLAHQFIGQLSPRMQKTIFGNVGSLVSFRSGSEDAEILRKEYDPIFTERDIINLGVREFYCKMSIKGEITQAFSGRTLAIEGNPNNSEKECIEFSRKTYCQPLADVKKTISAWEEGVSEPSTEKVVENKSNSNFSEPEFVEPLV